jgi:hypothetical protein
VVTGSFIGKFESLLDGQTSDLSEPTVNASSLRSAFLGHRAVFFLFVPSSSSCTFFLFVYLLPLRVPSSSSCTRMRHRPVTRGCLSAQNQVQQPVNRSWEIQGCSEVSDSAERSSRPFGGRAHGCTVSMRLTAAETPDSIYFPPAFSGKMSSVCPPRLEYYYIFHRSDLSY